MSREPSTEPGTRPDNTGSSVEEQASDNERGHNGDNEADNGDGGEGEVEDEGRGEGAGGDDRESDPDSEARSAEETKDSDDETSVSGQTIRTNNTMNEVDVPEEPVRPDTPSDATQENALEEMVDKDGSTIWIERYPCPTAGEPIRIEPEANCARTRYPDVGELSDPESFEIGRLLMESGVSGRSRNCYLRLKRVSIITI
jgi:hypothetical protein